MVDARNPLHMAAAAARVEWDEYRASWRAAGSAEAAAVSEEAQP